MTGGHTTETTGSRTTGTAWDAVSVTGLARRIAAGDLRPSDAVAQALARLDAAEDDLRAWLAVDRDAALAAARVLDERPGAGPLRGVPFGV
ncbi:MAG: Asp-tRNA(Asn)/Glu-tRNA(Gln) amidotransferase GatCAB subunit A, partial [Streptomycetaceae bacterium]|nr:Asp-tRNA(Asn)/Glu-tRNA(Gln) amidotransferase GatCAB subunit A [Streptomycetaceae bacterium]